MVDEGQKIKMEGTFLDSNAVDEEISSLIISVLSHS